MRNTLKVGAALLVVGSLCTSIVQAQQATEARAVRDVQVRNASNATTPRIEIATVDASWGNGCASSTVVREGDDRMQDQFLSMALAALLSGKKLKAYFPSANSCVFSRITIVQ